MPATEMRKHLLTRILPFWKALRDTAHGGYYGFISYDLQLNKLADKGCILNSRILWSFSTAARVLGDESLIPYAKQALDFLHRFRDPENGGVYWSVSYDGQPRDTTKHTYCQAFAIYGLAAWVRLTGDQQAAALARELFDLIESRCRDEGGYGEAFKADFSPESNEKLSENGVMASRTMNTLLHVVEAYAELYRATGDEDVRAAGERALHQVLAQVYDPTNARLDVFFDAEFKPLLNMQSYGHDIEASWLLWDAALALLPAERQAPYREMSLVLADSVLKRAMTPNGLRNECVDGVNDETRVWWVQAEAVLGFRNAYGLSRDARYRDAVATMWQVIQRIIIDQREGGEWHAATDPDGTPHEKPVVEEWKCPYHNSRMCLRMIEQA